MGPVLIWNVLLELEVKNWKVLRTLAEEAAEVSGSKTANWTPLLMFVIENVAKRPHVFVPLWLISTQSHGNRPRMDSIWLAEFCLIRGWRMGQFLQIQERCSDSRWQTLLLPLDAQTTVCVQGSTLLMGSVLSGGWRQDDGVRSSLCFHHKGEERKSSWHCGTPATR